MNILKRALIALVITAGLVAPVAPAHADGELLCTLDGVLVPCEDIPDPCVVDGVQIPNCPEPNGTINSCAIISAYLVAVQSDLASATTTVSILSAQRASLTAERDALVEKVKRKQATIFNLRQRIRALTK